VLHRDLVTAFVRLFPLWVTFGGVVALVYPPAFTWFLDYGLITPGLQIIMLGMGLTLKLTDFSRVFRAPAPILWGVLLQYTVMPLLGWGVSILFQLPTPFAVGLVLVSCCPGGTASNVVCFIAKLNVALSVTLTTCSTLLAVLMTPLLTTWLVQSASESLTGTAVEVDTLGLLIKTFQVVILPVTAGVLLNHYFPSAMQRVTPYTPFLAVLSIVFIVDYILAAKKQSILESGGDLLLAVVTLHFLGFVLGYILARITGVEEQSARTISVEVGMQNSGLATELARTNFAAFPLATVPGAISALTHCILGSIFAAAAKRRS